MFSDKFILTCMFAILTCAFISCSGPESKPATSPISPQAVSAPPSGTSAAQNSHYLWGYFLISYDSANGKVELIPVRDAVTHWNVLKFLEQGPCTNCVKVKGVTPSPSGTKLFDLEIAHPFLSPNLTGFDVRGIAMFHGTEIFPVAGLNLPDRTKGDGELVNPDGYTTLYNFGTSGSGPGGLQGYLKGKFASPTAPSASLNGYKRHISPGAANTRNAFFADDKVLVTYELDMPDTQFLFGYAIDANWAPPTVKPVTDPMTDFPPEANCPEPWRIDVNVVPVPGLTDQGGEVTINIDVYDRQGSDSHLAPTVECPPLFEGIKVADFVLDHPEYSSWEVKVGNEKKAGSGTHRFVVKVVDDEDLTAPAWLDLTAYQVGIVIVSPTGWSQTWGGIKADKSSAVATDTMGNAYIAGSFRDTVDFDPGPGTDNHTAVSQDDAFLCKYDSSGTFQWARTWGGDNPESVGSVCVDTSERIYVTGVFGGTVDFDPGPGVDNHTGAGFMDAYLTKLDSNGDYFWTRTWGGQNVEIGTGVTVDAQGDIYVSGYFNETVDFDPGPGEWGKTSNGDNDMSLSKFEPGGDWLWTNVWGGIGEDSALGVVMDSSGNPCVTGYFRDKVDFDAGSGVEDRTSNGNQDAFLVSFADDGGFLWVDTWGGTASDSAKAVEYDPNAGVFYVAGTFVGETDLDPGPGDDKHTSLGANDAFLSCLDSAGAFQWARTWGGTVNEYVTDVEVDQTTGPAVSGFFASTLVDFDPGAGTDNHTMIGVFDAFLSTFDGDGNFYWARTWGGSDYDCCHGVAVSQGSSCIYAVGEFKATVDMDPGPANDDHTSNGEGDAFLSKFLDDGSW